MSKRIYELKLTKDRPAYFEDVGHLLKLSGILLQGMGESFLLLLPNADNSTILPAELDDGGVLLAQPTPEEWSELLRFSDDPLFYDESSKAWVHKSKYAISGHVQQKIWVRDDLRCMYCGRKIGDVQLTIDHFIPLELGGENDPSNYLSCCRKCGKKKGNIHPEKWCEENDYDYRGLQLYMRGKCPMSYIFHLRG